MLAWLDFGYGVVMVGSAFDPCREVHQIYSSAAVGRAAAVINVRGRDIGSRCRRVVEAGALVTMPAEDAFYGFGRFEANDPGGNRWHVRVSFAEFRSRGGQLDGGS